MDQTTLRQSNQRLRNRSAALGAAFLIATVIAFWFELDFIRNAKPATGTFVFLQVDDVAIPYVQFTTEDGKDVAVQANEGNLFVEYKSGKQTDIYYDARDPASIEFNNVFILWGATGLFLGLSAGCFFFSYGINRHIKRWNM